MKTITNQLRTIILLSLLLAGLYAKTQTCTASFIYSLMPNGVVNFSSTSTPGNSTTTQYYWTFGNNTNHMTTGTPTATATYTANGAYNVVLWLSTPGTGSCQAVASITISNTANNCNLVANFYSSYAGQSGVQGYTSACTGTVAGTTYYWDFGNGVTSNLATTTATYYANVPYTVTLVANNNFTPTCISVITRTIYIVSIPGCNWMPSFSYSVGANGMVNFTNTSTGGSFYYWSFGDNTTGSGSAASHTYTQNGTYTVVLTVKSSSVNPTPNGTCIKTATQVITVNSASPCPVNASFSVVSTNTAQYWVAIPASTLNVANAVWNWGDGSSSNGLFSSHQYSVAGSYTLCLSVTVSCGASASACNTYSIYRSAEEMSMIKVNVMSVEEYAALPTGIVNVLYGQHSIGVYPNPNGGVFELRTNAAVSQPVTVDIYSITGEKVFSESLDLSNQTSKLVDAGKLPAGIYFIKLNDTVKKIVIDK